MDLDNQSLDHDDLLGVESLEDIIDVENEMGFGEGEDWSHDDNTAGYGKLAARTQCGQINKASTVHGRPRTNPLTVHPHRSRKPATIVRGGLKHGISSNSDSEEKPQIRAGVKHAFGSFSNGAKNLKVKEEARHHLKVKEEAKDDTDDMPQKLELDEDIELSSHNSYDEEDVEDYGRGLDTKVDNVSVSDASKYNVSERGMKGEIAGKIDRTVSSKDYVHQEAKKGLAKRDEKVPNSNRVRFSLDVETAEKAMGCGQRRGIEAKEKAKCGKQQEWRYVRSTPSDSSGFGTPKATPAVSLRPAGTQRRKEMSITETLKDPSLEFDLEKAIEARDDKKAARLALERVERFEDAMLKQQEIVGSMRLFLASEGTKDNSKLRQLVDALDRNIRRVCASSKAHQVPQSYELKNRAEQINRLKAQCNLLETDRERLKKKLRHFLENVDEKERVQEVNKQTESEAAVNERESILEQKVKDLEMSLVEWETKLKKVESDFAIEKAHLEDSLSVCKHDWRNKQQRWSSKMKEREAELSHMKASEDKLVDSLMSCRQCLDKLRREAAVYSRDFAHHGAGGETEEEDMVLKSIDDTNALSLAYSIQNDMENLRRLLAESSSVLQHDASLQPEVLRQESEILENKVAQTISLMTEIKQEMKSKEHQIRKENEKYAEVVAEKAKQVEALEEQLANKEQDMECFMQELQEKVSLLNKELESERSEKYRLSELQGNMKYKLLKGLRKKEQKLEEEIAGLKERLEEMKTTVAEKDERLASLEDEVKAKCAQLVHEKQKWNMAIKEVKQKAAKTILRFMHGKENGLLEHLRERKKNQRTGDVRVGLSCKIDDDDEDDDDDDDDDDNDGKDKGSGGMRQEGLMKRSVKDNLDSKRHQARIMSGEFNSPRDSHRLLPRNFNNVATNEDLRSSFEKEKAKHDYDLVSRKEDLCLLQETYPRAYKLARRHRAMDKRDWKSLD